MKITETMIKMVAKDPQHGLILTEKDNKLEFSMSYGSIAQLCYWQKFIEDQIDKAFKNYQESFKKEQPVITPEIVHEESH